MSVTQRGVAPPQASGPPAPLIRRVPVLRITRGAGTAAVRLTEVSKVYGKGRSSLLALDKVSLAVRPASSSA